MSDKPSISAEDNRAEISLPAGLTVQAKVKTNSGFVQRVVLKGGDAEVDFAGSGEENSVIGEAELTTTGSPFLAEFAYSPDGDTAFTPSRLNAGGPYTIGNYNILVVVAENGDDTDWNDTILELSWYTPKDA